MIKIDNIITNSRMACARTCLRKHWLRYEVGMRPVREATALRFGSAFHLGVEQLAAGADIEHVVSEATSAYDDIPAWADREDWLVEKATIDAMLRGYAWRWSEDGWRTIAGEQTFRIPLRNPDTGSPSTLWTVAGKIDRIVELPDGRLAIVETKTTGDSLDPDSDYWRRLRIDAQISLYMIAARALGHDVTTIIYDVARKPGIAPKKLTKAQISEWSGWGPAPERETPDMFAARLLSDIGERPDFYFARREIPRLEADIDEFRRELWDQAADLRERRRNNRWYRNSSACVGFGRCEYLDICASGWSINDSIPDGFSIVEDVHTELGETR